MGGKNEKNNGIGTIDGFRGGTLFGADILI